MGLLLIGHSGGILAANRIGRQTLHHGGTISVSGGVVTLSPVAHNRRFQSLLRSARAGECSHAAIRVPRRSGKPLLILFIPLRKEAGQEPEDGPLALLVMNGSQPRPDLSLLTDFFGFTPAESRVAAIMMQGKAVVDVSRTLEISENTTRNHLKHMYSKTMTRKQGQLVHTLLSSPAALQVSWASEDEGPEPKLLHRIASRGA